MTQTRPLSDQQLLLAYARENSDDAFRAVVDRHARWIFAAAFRQLADRQLAEDATQIVFVLLAQRSRKMSANQKLSGWLFNTLGYTVKNLRRQLLRRQFHEQRAAVERPGFESSGRIDDLAENLDAAVADLPRADREIILLRYYQDRSFEEIAGALGITATTARKRVSRGTQKLRNRLEQIGAGRLMGTGGLSAAVVRGLDHAPHSLAPSVAQIALAAKAGAAIPPTILTATKGTAFLMAAAKTKALAIMVLICLLVVPGTIVAVYYAPSFFAESNSPVPVAPVPASVPAITQAEALSDREPWQSENLSSEMVGRLPPEVSILPTKFPAGSKTRLVGYAPGAGKFVGLRASVADMLSVAYAWSAQRMIFEVDQPQDRYDFIATLSQGSLEALQAELQSKFGFVVRGKPGKWMCYCSQSENPNAPASSPPKRRGELLFSGEWQ